MLLLMGFFYCCFFFFTFYFYSISPSHSDNRFSEVWKNTIPFFCLIAFLLINLKLYLQEEQ